MLIAIDYDGTYTADPGLWSMFIKAALDRNHAVVCVTMRHAHEAIGDIGIPVYYTGRKAKALFMCSCGIKPDIWVDDSPGWIFNDG